MIPNRILLSVYTDNIRVEGFEPLHKGVFDIEDINESLIKIRKLKFYGRVEFYIHDSHNYARLTLSREEITLSTFDDLRFRIYNTLKRTFLDRVFINLRGS